jgi:hypothetical protein
MEHSTMSQNEDVAPGPEPSLASRAARARSFDGPGVAVQVGGGIMNFGSTQMQELTQSGGYWDARLVLGLRRIWAFELAYVGTANRLNAPGVADGSWLVGNGAEGGLRLNIPLLRSEGGYLIPYAVAGLGWQRFVISNGSTDGRMLASTDDVLTVPVGGGVTIGYQHLYLDTRLSYRLTQYDDLIAAGNPPKNQLRQWAFGGNIGYLF